MRSFKESEFVSFCQNVMTGNVVVSESSFFKKVSEILHGFMDPITKNFLKKKTSKLYAFLTTMKSHPMRVPLSHAMSGVFLGTVAVGSKEISKLLFKYNTEYFIPYTQKSVYEDFIVHILDEDALTKGTGNVKVVFMYRHKQVQYGVVFKFTVPFKTAQKSKLYIDLDESERRPKGKKTRTYVYEHDATRVGEFYLNIPNDEILSVKSPVGENLFEYYKIWKTREDAIDAR